MPNKFRYPLIFAGIMAGSFLLAWMGFNMVCWWIVLYFIDRNTALSLLAIFIIMVGV